MLHIDPANTTPTLSAYSIHSQLLLTSFVRCEMRLIVAIVPLVRPWLRDYIICAALWDHE
jgi:hypothetical protein